MDIHGMFDRLVEGAGKALEHLEANGSLSNYLRAERAAHELRQVVTRDGKYVPSGAVPDPPVPHDPDPPYQDGDVWVLAPGLVSTTEAPEESTVLSWRGENFTVQSDLKAPAADGDHSELRGNG